MSSVSVVIPTAGRAPLLRRALASVAAQTLAPLEVFVVVARPDPPTEALIAELAPTFPALRVLRSERPLSGSDARQLGIREAKGEWIALLDDDDEWLPEKLATQMETVRPYHEPYVASYHCFTARRPSGDERGPRELLKPGTKVADYLLVRHSFFRGAAAMQSSTILARRALLLAVPFRTGGPEDIDWALRADATPGMRWVPCDAVLAIWHSDVERNRVSTGRSWQSILAWLDEILPLIGRRAYASYALVECGARAARIGQVSAVSVLLRQAFSRGRPRPLDLAVFASFWLFPARWRVAIRRSLHS